MTDSNKEVQFFLIHLDLDLFELFFVELLSSGIALEVLDPRELGTKWQNISFLNSQKNLQLSQNQTPNLKAIKQTIDNYSPSFCFEEKYETGNINKILENWQEKNLMDAVLKLNSSSIINKKFLQKKSILKKNKNKWELTIIRDLKALYTKYEISSILPLIYQKLFKLEKDSEVNFICFAIPKSESQKTINILKAHQIDYEITSWTRQITLKESSSNLGFGINSFGETSKLSSFTILNNYLLSAIILHDTFLGLIILIAITSVYRLELKNKFFFLQIWIGLGSLVFGVIGGSFAGNLFLVLAMSKNTIIKEFGGATLDFLSLFQIIDWTNQSQNLLLNYVLRSQKLLPSLIFCGIFTMISCIIIVFGQVTKISYNYKNNQSRQAIAYTLLLSTIVVWGFTVLRYAPPWLGLIFTFALLVFQPDTNIIAKIKTFFVSEFGIVGFLKICLKSLWFGAIFGITISSTLLFNFANNFAGDNLIVMVFLDIFIAIFLWQITTIVVAKTIKANLIDQIRQKANTEPNTGKVRKFDPISKFKYWKF